METRYGDIMELHLCRGLANRDTIMSLCLTRERVEHMGMFFVSMVDASVFDGVARLVRTGPFVRMCVGTTNNVEVHNKHTTNLRFAVCTFQNVK